mgnify:CR=1 FL=1
MKLYCFGESGHSYKAALALQLADIDWTPIFVDFFKPFARFHVKCRICQYAKMLSTRTKNVDRCAFGIPES